MPAKIVYETGNEPDFTVDDIPRVERLSDGTVRLYCAAFWKDGVRIEYSVRCNKARLAEFGRLLLVIAADVHNADTLEERIESTH